MQLRKTVVSLPPFNTIASYPFDVIEMKGEESIDFLHRISTNDFTGFQQGSIRPTLFVSDKGRIIDTVWVLYRDDAVMLLVSKGMGREVAEWLRKYIVMEDIILTDVSDRYSISINFKFDDTLSGYRTDYFSLPVKFEISRNPSRSNDEHAGFHLWRIRNGIPFSKKEMVQDYNPLELHLWNWINFTKGCYIGQEVIARLDTYNKIQRALYRFSFDGDTNENEILCDNLTGRDIGKITSVAAYGTMTEGLAVVRTQDAARPVTVKRMRSGATLILEPLVQ